MPDALLPDEPIPETSFGPVSPFYDTLMAGVPYRFWADYLGKVWKRHGQSPRTVLDLACGTGTVSRLLAGRGYFPTGVDLSAGMLAVARTRAAASSCPGFSHRGPAICTVAGLPSPRCVA